MEFVELACQFWTGKMADFVEKLNMVQSVLRDFEKIVLSVWLNFILLMLCPAPAG